MAAQDYNRLSDEELALRYTERNEHMAFTSLYERYAHLVMGVCMKHLKDLEQAKEATQQIFVKLLEDLKKYEITYFKSWLYKVASNHCLMILRKKDVTSSEEINEEIMEFEDEWHHKVKQDQFLTELETAVQELSKEQRVCIRHFYMQKMSYAEVARQTSYDIKTVKSAIQNGKRNLKIKLSALLEKSHE